VSLECGIITMMLACITGLELSDRLSKAFTIQHITPESTKSPVRASKEESAGDFYAFSLKMNSDKQRKRMK
jgi:hypothetical protein